MDDEMILDMFFARDENAITQTDNKYGRRLCALSFNIIISEQDAEECVNDTYLAAWNAIPPTRPDCFYAYLCKIVRNISYTLFHRSTAQKRNANMVALSEELLEITASRTGEVDDFLLGQAIDKFVRSLDEDTRMLFVRRYFYADSIEKIAGLTRISYNNIAVKLLRARKKLKIFLEKEGFVI